MPSMKNCPDAETLGAFIDGSLTGDALRSVTEHLASCEECMAVMSGTNIPLELAERLQSVADRPEEVRRIGVEHATLLCQELLRGGAPGLHFYTMNRAAATLEVCANLGWETARAT